VDWISLVPGRRQLMASGEYGNELSGSIKYGEFLG